MHPLLVICIFLTTFLSYSGGSPVLLSVDSHLEARKAVDCNSLDAKFDQSCWGTLGVSDFLHRWIDDHKCKDGVISTREVVSSGCCDNEDPWSSCFLRLEKGERGYDCTNINPQLCSWDAQQLDKTGPDAARISYVLRGIYTVNNFFSTWYTSLQYATSKTDLIVESLINRVDIIKPQSSLLNILSGLIAGLAFLGAPSIGAAVASPALSASASAVANTAVVGLQAAPGLVKSLWPTGSIESRVIQIGNVNDELSRSNDALSDRLSNTLGTVMTDFNVFLTFAFAGSWTTQENLSINQTTKSLTYGLHNYVTSLVLSKNGWYGLLADTQSLDPTFYPDLSSVESKGFRDGVTCDRNTNICVAVHHQQPPPPAPPLKPKTDKNSAWWYSNTTKRLYTLVNNKAKSELSSEILMQEIIAREWASLELLFDGAFNCHWQGRQGQPLDIFPNAKLDASCVSQLPMKRTCKDNNCFPGSWMGGAAKDWCPFEQMDKNECIRA